MMRHNFDRADEDALSLGASYNFRRLGFEGLSVVGTFARGWGAQDEFGASLNDRRELDLTLDYRLQRGALKGLWFRIRGAFLNEYGSGARSSNEFRVIIRYDLPLLTD